MRRHSSHTSVTYSRTGNKILVPFFAKKITSPKSVSATFKKAPNFTAFGGGNAGSMRIEGRTVANYSHSHVSQNETVTPATGCGRCGRSSPCVEISGELVSTFATNPVVTLPDPARFRRLTDCQRQRVEDGINNVLAPHEQRHVAIFRTYDGSLTTPFTFKICQSQQLFNQRLRTLHNSIEQPRRRQVQAESNAIDPFFFNVDLNCQDT